MASFNRVILMGNLTRDPDVRATGTTGMKVARLGLAVNERRKDRNGQLLDFPVFVDVDAWDKLAELCGQYLTKGRTILVEGRLQMDTWEKDGVRHQKLKVRASTIKFLPQGERLAGGIVRQPLSEGEAAAAIPAPVASAEPLENDPDNIPF
ncbi:MAG TPA: single-stranded DNA-binding protein [Verrucomicrobia bacterium]|nr:single-stranded DNA-binding protein [Verrucomicrobiota bacterium]HCG20685.1 single-stranded DNA-binding protein [Verrucomicrobiota bacterium]